MPCDEILKTVFPFLEGADLAKCMVVSKQWREIAGDDYFWKSLCAKRWPSICKQPQPPTSTYYKLFQTFCKRQRYRRLLPPRLSLSDLEFYVDIWTDDHLIFSEVVPGPTLQKEVRIPQPGICKVFDYLKGPEYNIFLPVERMFTIPSSHSVTASVLVVRKDTNRVSCIIDKSASAYIDREENRAIAFHYLDFSPSYFNMSVVQACLSLLFLDNSNDEEAVDVFSIVLDFDEAFLYEEEVLWLLDMLDWK